MDLKFTFGGASPDHRDHGGAPSGIPLPFSAAPASTSGVLEVHVRGTGRTIVAEALSGDGVVYCEAEVAAGDEDPAALARAARSALSRAVAALEGPLADSVSAVVVDLGGAEVAVLRELGLAVDAAQDPPAHVDEALQRRVGVASGTPIRLGA